jgi:hypothetical protein
MFALFECFPDDIVHKYKSPLLFPPLHSRLSSQGDLAKPLPNTEDSQQQQGQQHELVVSLSSDSTSDMSIDEATLNEIVDAAESEHKDKGNRGKE